MLCGPGEIPYLLPEELPKYQQSWSLVQRAFGVASGNWTTRTRIKSLDTIAHKQSILETKWLSRHVLNNDAQIRVDMH